METRKIEIVTPVHNRREETLQCLRSLSKVETSGLSLHIVIVDDGSTDGTAEAVAAAQSGGAWHSAELATLERAAAAVGPGPHALAPAM